MSKQIIDLNALQLVKYKSGGVSATSPDKLMLNGKIIWQKFTTTPGFVLSGIDENGEPEYNTVLDSTTSGTIVKAVANSAYNGNPVKYYIGKCYQNPGLEATADNYYYDSSCHGVEDSIDLNMAILNLGGVNNDKPIDAVGWYTMYVTGGIKTFPNLEEINIKCKSLFAGGIEIKQTNSMLTINLGEELREIRADAEGTWAIHIYRDTPSGASTETPVPAEGTVVLNINAKQLECVRSYSGSGSSGRVVNCIDLWNSNITVNINSKCEQVVGLTGLIVQFIYERKSKNVTAYYILNIAEGTKLLKLTAKNTEETAVGTQNLLANLDEFIIHNRPLELSPAGRNTGLFYAKNAQTYSNIYTDNQAILDYDWGTDNITPTIRHLDMTTTYERLTAPIIALNGSIVTITPVAGAERYKVINGVNEELVEVDNSSLTIDLSQYLIAAGTYPITVRACATNKVSSVKSNSVSYVITEESA